MRHTKPKKIISKIFYGLSKNYALSNKLKKKKKKKKKEREQLQIWDKN